MIDWSDFCPGCNSIRCVCEDEDETETEETEETEAMTEETAAPAAEITEATTEAQATVEAAAESTAKSAPSAPRVRRDDIEIARDSIGALDDLLTRAVALATRNAMRDALSKGEYVPVAEVERRCLKAVEDYKAAMRRRMDEI